MITIEPTRITREELAEAENQYAEITRELELAKVKAADAVSEAARFWASQIAQRYAHETAATVRHLTEKANRLAAFLQSADVDPEPEPTPPAAPAARPVGIIERDRRVITARHFGSCRHCNRGIKPGDQIVRTYVAGVWSHPECFARDIAARKAEGERHRERALGACFLAFFDRLPSAA